MTVCHLDRLGKSIKTGDWCVAAYQAPASDGISIFKVVDDSLKLLKIKEIHTKKSSTFIRKYGHGVVKINSEDVMMMILKGETK